jgi:hypothetical protein
MKTNKFINILLSGLLGTYLISSCTSDFKDINTNKRVLAEIDLATVGNVYAAVQYNGLMSGWNFQISQNLFADLYTQYYSNWQTKFQTDRHVLNRDWLGLAWGGFYGAAANNLAVVMEKTNPVTVPGYEKQYALAQIWKVFMYQRQTDYWGPIPYSQVNNAQNAVAYDKQQDIYANFWVLLDSATTTLAGFAGQNAFGTNDQIYKGDIDKWIVFANTLRLRVAMRLSKVDPATAKTQAEKAVAAGVMESNADNAVFKTGPGDGGWNPLPIMLPWNEFRMSASMESLLKGYNDPRLAAYWRPVVKNQQGQLNNDPTLYRGMRNGLSISQISDSTRHYDKLSTMSARWSTPGNEYVTPIEVILSSDAYFLRAEGALKGWNMGITAEEAYNKGIEMSLSYWGASAAAITAYQQGVTTPIALPDFTTPPMTNIPVKFGADAATQLEQIMTQKWIALFPDGWESWADVRRTELPKLYPIIVSDNPDVPVDKLMRRVGYVPSELSSNADAVQAAISTMLGGPDNAATRLWWDPATK